MTKVHAIRADDGGQWAEAVTKRDALGKDIAALAKKTNTPVFFHDYKDDIAGGPVVLLECPDAFLELVKKLPGFQETCPASTAKGFETERSAKVQAYFTAPTPSVPKAPKPPKFG